MRLLAFVALISSSAFAQTIGELHEDQWVTSRAFATFGAVVRDSKQAYPEGPSVDITGGGPRLLAMHLSGAFFPRKFFGVGFGLRSDLVGAASEATGKLPQETVHGYATAVLRWQPALLFGLEGHLGWWGGRAALIRPMTPPTVDFLAMTGPVLGATFVFDPTSRLTAQLSGRVEVSVAQLTGFGITLGAQARYGLFDLGPFELGLAATFEISGGRWEGGTTVSTLNETGIRLGIGPSLVSRRPAPPSVVTAATAPSLVGSVTRTGGTPVSGATVTVGDRTTTTDVAGAFTLDGLPPGPATVAASAASLRPTSKQVVITPGVSVEVTLTLEAKTGPGSISGTVRAAPDKPLAGAKVTSGGTTATTSVTGGYTLAKMGPGAVKVRVTLDGYAPADEVVQVAAEANAELDVTLELATQRSKAKIRGVVSSAAGPVAKATVRIVELKLKQTVKSDGRFEAEVLGGRYTLIIEAAKHVTQTRVVEVADGDQAIFQIELEKVR
ncbi:MAG: carboxypeptidase regulatory-like domain-containing protein [Myxococcales bacterium]|nr:carboxypeptidase regulatory-like domain-containing protein [Myxococcales bacterium]